jgi:DNA-binding HxlR family transcriptional regulator
MKVKECYKTAEVWNSNQCLDMMCPIEFILDLIGTKWSISILRELFRGNQRTHELLEALPGISTKTLTVRLRELEKHGLIHRRVYAEIPPRVEYSLTEKGLELQPVLVALKQVGEQWLKDNHCICPLELTL